jgi:hypothetical protein
MGSTGRPHTRGHLSHGQPFATKQHQLKQEFLHPLLCVYGLSLMVMVLLLLLA